MDAISPATPNPIDSPTPFEAFIQAEFLRLTRGGFTPTQAVVALGLAHERQSRVIYPEGAAPGGFRNLDREPKGILAAAMKRVAACIPGVGSYLSPEEDVSPEAIAYGAAAMPERLRAEARSALRGALVEAGLPAEPQDVENTAWILAHDEEAAEGLYRYLGRDAQGRLVVGRYALAYVVCGGARPRPGELTDGPASEGPEVGPSVYAEALEAVAAMRAGEARRARQRRGAIRDVVVAIRARDLRDGPRRAARAALAREVKGLTRKQAATLRGVSEQQLRTAEGWVLPLWRKALAG